MFLYYPEVSKDSHYKVHGVKVNKTVRSCYYFNWKIIII